MNAEIVLRGFVALSRRADEPSVRLLHVLLNAAAGLVTKPEIALSRRDLLLGGRVANSAEAPTS